MLNKAGETSDVQYWLGANTLFSLLTWLAITILPWSLYGYFSSLYLLAGLGIGLLILSTVHLILYLKVEDRIKRIEEVIPDMLQLIASNLRAGMTPYQALNVSARPEFGPLSEEMKIVVKRSQGTESFPELLLRMTENIRSDMLDRVVKMFSSAIHSGGKLAQLLEDIALDISQTKELKEELMTTTKTYTTFIMFTIIIGTPLLLAISIHFIELIANIQTKAPAAVGFGMQFLSGGVMMTPEFLTTISLILLIVTSILTSMLIGVIKEGKELYGLRYSPVLIIGTLMTFFIARYIVGSIFTI